MCFTIYVTAYDDRNESDKPPSLKPFWKTNYKKSEAWELRAKAGKNVLKTRHYFKQHDRSDNDRNQYYWNRISHRFFDFSFKSFCFLFVGRNAIQKRL